MPPEATLPRKPLDLILIGGQVGAGVGKESFIVALQRANGGVATRALRRCTT